MPITPSKLPNRKTEVVTTRVQDTGAGAVATGANQLARGVQQLTGAVVDEFDRFTRNNDEMAASEVLISAEREINDALYNPETGIMYRRGKDTFGAAEEFYKKFDDNDMFNELPPRARAIALEGIFPALTRAGQTVSRHEGDHRQLYQDDLLKQEITVKSKSFADSFMEPIELVQERLDDIGNASDTFNLGQGRGADTAALLRAAQAQDLILQRATNAIEADRYDFANVLITAHGDKLSDGALEKIKNKINDRSMVDGASEAVEVALMSGDTTYGGIREKSIKRAKQYAELNGIPWTPAYTKTVNDLADSTLRIKLADSAAISDRNAQRSVGKYMEAIQTIKLGNNVKNPITDTQVETLYQQMRSDLFRGGRFDEIETLDKLHNNWREDPTSQGYARVNDTEVQYATDKMTPIELADTNEAWLDKMKAYLTPTKHGMLAERWVSAHQAKSTRSQAQSKAVRERFEVTEDKLSAALLSSAQAAGFFSGVSKDTELSIQQQALFNEYKDQLWLDMGENPTRDDMNNSLQNLLYREANLAKGYDRGKWFGGQETWTRAELMADPTLVRFAPELMKELEVNYGLSLEQFDQGQALHNALSRYFTDQINRSRAARLADPKAGVE